MFLYETSGQQPNAQTPPENVNLNHTNEVCKTNSYNTISKNCSFSQHVWLASLVLFVFTHLVYIFFKYILYLWEHLGHKHPHEHSRWQGDDFSIKSQASFRQQ